MRVYSSSNLTPTRSDAAPHWIFCHLYHSVYLRSDKTVFLVLLLLDPIFARRLCSVFPVRMPFRPPAPTDVAVKTVRLVKKNKGKKQAMTLSALHAVLRCPCWCHKDGASHSLQRALVLNCNLFQSIFDSVTKSAVHQRASPPSVSLPHGPIWYDFMGFSTKSHST